MLGENSIFYFIIVIRFVRHNILTNKVYLDVGDMAKVSAKRK